MNASLRLRLFRRAHLLSGWMQRHSTGTGNFVSVGLLVSGVLGFDTTRNMSYQIFCLLAVLGGVALAGTRLRRLHCVCQRHLPALATVDQPLHYRISVSNPTVTDLRDLSLVDELLVAYPDREQLQRYTREEDATDNWFDRRVGFPRWVRLLRLLTGADDARIEAFDLAARQSRDLELRLLPLRRGTLHFSRIHLGDREPLGLWRRELTCEAPASLLVLPRRYPVPALRLSGGRQHHPGGISLASAVGETSEFHSLRDYRPGDPLRRIHWRSWAHTGAPVVKTYEEEFFVRHALLLDTYSEIAADACFEAAVSTAASVVCGVQDQESLLDLLFIENTVYCYTSGRHVSDELAMLEVLANVQATANNDFSQLADYVLGHSHGLSSVICVLLSWDASRRELVRSLRARGVNVLVLMLHAASLPPPATDSTFLGPLADAPQAFYWINAGDPASGLARLGAGSGVRP